VLDGVDHISGLDWYTPDEFNIPRHSVDEVVNVFGRGLIELCTEFNIHILNGRATGDNPGQFTNITESGCSTVDYVIVDSSLYNSVESFEVLEFAETNHLPIQCTFNIFNNDVDQANVNVNHTQPLVSKEIKFKWQNESRPEFVGKLTDEVATANLTNFSELIGNDIDEALNVFESVIHRAAESMEINHNKHFKTKLQPRWWDKTCDKLKAKKYDALKKFKVSHSTEALSEFKAARSKFKNTCSQKATEWKNKLKEKLVSCKADPVMFWKTVKSINVKQMLVPCITPVEWFTYFEKLLNQDVNLNVEFKDIVDDFIVNHDADCDTCNGHDQGNETIQELNDPITTDEIVRCVRSMSNGKSSGIDGIVIEMLKASLHVTEPYLRHLYNSVLNTGKFPEQWCKAVLVPIHKKGKLSDPNNYRGIALLSVLGKIFTKIINSRLVYWAEENEIQKEEQAGFRKGYSTVDNMFVLQSLVQKYCSKKGGRFYVVYVDFSKAFDTVPHALMFYQLISKGVHGKVLKVLRSMYGSLKSCVRTKHGLTDFFNCSKGTRQGCMLSPFLFSLYVGELVTMFEEAGCQGTFIDETVPNIAALLFADDVIAGADSVGRLQSMINVISAFCDRWGLIVNLAKTKVMVFRNGGPLRANERWFYNGVKLEVVSAYKYLGGIFTTKLVWTECQRTLAIQARRGLHLLRKYDYACDGLPIDLQFNLFDSMISPILLYGSEIWGFSEAKHIEKVQSDYCKHVMAVPSHTPNIAVLAETGRFPMFVHYYRRCIKYWLKLLHMPNTRYPKACYKMLLNLDRQGRVTWASHVRNLLCKYDFGEVWEAQGVENWSLFLKEFTQRVQQKYCADWEYDLGQSSKLYLFRSLKESGINSASYLYHVTIRKYRAGLAKLRCSSHDLNIEKGRHTGVLVADRVCKLCLNKYSRHVLEDEYHFLMCCPQYNDLRDTYFPAWAKHESYENFLALLGTEDDVLIKDVASYVYQANKLRWESHKNAQL
jgi:hypothetical protein